jgi:hypothetical protein
VLGDIRQHVRLADIGRDGLRKGCDARVPWRADDIGHVPVARQPAHERVLAPASTYDKNSHKLNTLRLACAEMGLGTYRTRILRATGEWGLE